MVCRCLRCEAVYLFCGENVMMPAYENVASALAEVDVPQPPPAPTVIEPEISEQEFARQKKAFMSKII